mmetsp:Transcript_25192/g.39293  ORF Transcript_25192/g.39293 Transcript_25192/m.39293 type:complete len:367 (+) Transcript_25192:260-1360(+)
MTKSHGSTIDVEFVEVSSNLLLPSQRDRGKCLIHLIKIDLINAKPRFLQNFLGGRNRNMKHHNRVIPSKSQSDNLSTGLQSKLLQTRFITHEDGRCSITDLGRAGSSDTPSFSQQLELSKFFSISRPPDSLILLQYDITSVLALALDADQFALESTRNSGFVGFLVRNVSKVIHLRSGDSKFLGNHLGSFELGEHDTLPIFLLDLFSTPRLPMPSHHTVLNRRPNGALRHHLNTSSNDNILRSTHHCLGSKVESLLGRPTLAINRGPRDRNREFTGQHTVAAKISSLRPNLGDTPKDDIVNQLSLEVISINKGVNHNRSKVRRVVLGKSSIALPYRSPDGVNNVGSFRHGEELRVRKQSQQKKRKK